MKKAFSLVWMLCILASCFVYTPVYAADTSDFEITADASVGNGGILTVRVGAKNIDTPLDALCATLFYDPAVLTLLNTIDEENVVDCLLFAPDANWENLCIAQDGCVQLRACNALCTEQLTNDTTIVYELYFAIADGADATVLQIPTASTEGIDNSLCYHYGIGTELTVSFPAPNETALCGDVNGDGVINGKDATRLLSYLADYNYQDGTSTIEITLGADCNSDGTVDGRDSIRLLRYLASIDPETGISDVVLGT